MKTAAILRLLVGSALVVLAWAAGGGCYKPAPYGETGFKLFADSLGAEPLHEDAKLSVNLDKAHDGLGSTRWSTVGPMRKGFFLELEFDGTPEVRELVLDSGPSPYDYPRAFTVEVLTADGAWENVGFYDEKATVKGVTTIRFREPRAVRALVIRLTEDAGFWWSVHELRVR